MTTTKRDCQEGETMLYRGHKIEQRSEGDYYCVTPPVGKKWGQLFDTPATARRLIDIVAKTQRLEPRPITCERCETLGRSRCILHGTF